MLLCEDFIVQFHVYYHCNTDKAKRVEAEYKKSGWAFLFLMFVITNLHLRVLLRILLIEYLQIFFFFNWQALNLK